MRSGVVIARRWLPSISSLRNRSLKSSGAYDPVINRPTVIVAEVNADEDHELSERFSIEGYPTLKFFPAGSTDPVDYNGGREAKDLVDFLNEKLGIV